MKILKRIRLINWHFFQDESLEFGDQTLLTGPSGSGKSTIIDALQVLFVANLKQIRFNSAAHEDAKRTLISYLRGKIGGEVKGFLREKDFNTYIVAEFYDKNKKESFIAGVVFDVYLDDVIVEEYFIIANFQISDLEFFKEPNRLKNRSEFHKNYFRPDRIFERSKTEYQKALSHRMGQIHDRFFSTFVKALSFKPIDSVRNFVYQNILDQKELQLGLLKENFEIHERYRRELDALMERKNELQKICSQYDQYIRYRDQVDIQEYLILGLRYQQQSEFKVLQEQKIQVLQKEIKNLENLHQLASDQHQEANQKELEAHQRWQNDVIRQREKELKKELDDINKELREQKQLLVYLCQNLKQEMILLSELESYKELITWDKFAMDRILETGGFLAELWQNLQNDWQPDDQTVQRCQEIGRFLGGICASATKDLGRLEDQLHQLEKEQAELQKELRDLEQKKRTYRPELVNLKRLLEERLGSRSPIWVFCEEMELKDEEWRNAIEGYLHTQRFDLLVKPECFAEALSIYEREKWKYHIEGVGLVDTEKEVSFLSSTLENSLAEELITTNLVVQARINHLLGRVMKAKDEQDLRNHKSAVTKSCMSYNNLVARQIIKERYSIPYIGVKAIKQQIEIKKEDLTRIGNQLSLLRQDKNQLIKIIEMLSDKKLVYIRISEQLYLPMQIVQMENEQKMRSNELAQLDLRSVKQLEEEYLFWKGKIEELVKEISQLSGKKERSSVELNQLQTDHYLLQNKITEYENNWNDWGNQLSFELLLRAKERWLETDSQMVAIADKLANLERNQKSNATIRDNEFKKLRNLRNEYNIRYAYNSDPDDLVNNDYQELLNNIESVDIPKYQQKVGEALRQSEEEFKSHFIFKLREAIETAKEDFVQLNYALRNFPYYEERYHFEVKPNDSYRRFYDVIMDSQMFESGSLFELPEDDKIEVLHELFEKLIRGQLGEIDEFTDYRNYLDFDMIITTQNNRISFSKVLREKSGGETQTPFYIAILASFNQLYSSGKTMRLVVFDEAFNKMDEERIKTTLRLIKQMNLQLVAAVPDEKMQHMATEVSTTLVVQREGFHCFVDLIDRSEVLEAAVVQEI